MRIIIGLALIAILTIPAVSYAAGGCPRTADRLEDFASCLVETRSGAALRGGSQYSAQLDSDHHELLNALAANSGVPPQVMPPSVPIISAPFMPMYYPVPFYPVTRANVWLYTGYGMNPYVTVRYSVPLY